MMITMLFYLEKTLPKNFKQKLHQVVEAEVLKVEAEAIQKMPLPHSC